MLGTYGDRRRHNSELRLAAYESSKTGNGSSLSQTDVAILDRIYGGQNQLIYARPRKVVARSDTQPEWHPFEFG